MDDFKNQNGKREFLEGAPEDNKVKINFENIESTESGFVQNERFGVAEEYDNAQTVAMNNEPVYEQPVVVNDAFIAPPPVQQDVPVQPPVQDVYVQPAPQKDSKKNAKKALSPEEKKAKKAKNNKAFGTFIRIFVIVILSVATLWTVMYTVDHTLAAQGIGPVFSYSENEYTVSYIDSEDAGAWSYECLGYKVQFVFDENGQLKQDCVWAWQEGPNDVLLKRGILFELNSAD